MEVSCDAEREIFTAFYTTLNGSFIMILIRILYTFIQINQPFASKGTPKEKQVKRIGFTLIILTFIDLILHIIYMFNICQYGVQNVFLTLFNMIYAIQLTLVMFIWFNQIRLNFSGTQFQLNNKTEKFYLITFTLLFIMGISIVASQLLISHIKIEGIFLFAFFAAFAILLYLILVISLSILFIYKLISVYKNYKNVIELAGSSQEYNQDQYEIVHIITKLSVLNFISLFVTQFVMASVFVYNGSIQTEFFNHCACIIDVFTNCACIILSYPSNKTSYLIFCKVVHFGCNRFWNKIFDDDKNGQAVVTDNKESNPIPTATIDTTNSTVSFEES